MKREHDLLSIKWITPNQIKVELRIPKFKGYETEEFRAKIKEIENLGSEIGDKITHLFETYELPSCTCGNCRKDDAEDFRRFLEELFGIRN